MPSPASISAPCVPYNSPASSNAVLNYYIPHDDLTLAGTGTGTGTGCTRAAPGAPGACVSSPPASPSFARAARSASNTACVGAGSMLSILCSRMSPVCGEKRYVEFLGARVRQSVSGLWTEGGEGGGGKSTYTSHPPRAPLTRAIPDTLRLMKRLFSRNERCLRWVPPSASGGESSAPPLLCPANSTDATLAHEA